MFQRFLPAFVYLEIMRSAILLYRFCKVQSKVILLAFPDFWHFSFFRQALSLTVRVASLYYTQLADCSIDFYCIHLLSGCFCFLALTLLAQKDVAQHLANLRLEQQLCAVCRDAKKEGDFGRFASETSNRLRPLQTPGGFVPSMSAPLRLWRPWSLQRYKKALFHKWQLLSLLFESSWTFRNCWITRLQRKTSTISMSNVPGGWCVWICLAGSVKLKLKNFWLMIEYINVYNI